MTPVNKIKRILAIISATFLLLLATSADAGSFGVTLPIIVKGKDPDNLHAYRAVLWYQPTSLTWSHWSIYFAANGGHWWSSSATQYRSLNIFAIAPVFRFYPIKFSHFSPFLEASIGPAYLSKTHFSDRNLGMHFAFQDEIAAGATFGPQQRLSASLSVLHYSNGRLCAYNAGITAYAVLNLGYRFG